MERSYDLGPVPRPAVVQFIRPDGTQSAWYALAGDVIEPPEGVAAVVIRQLPVFPADYPAGDEPGWGNKEGGYNAVIVPPGEGAETRVEVRGRERFQKAYIHLAGDAAPL